MLEKAHHQKLRFYNNLKDEATRLKVELFEQATFDLASRKTWVKFMYSYCDNEFNRSKGRVGKIAGFRIGTRNLDLVPTADKPRGRKPGGKVTRYYDVTRAQATVSGGISSGGLRGKVQNNSAQQGQWRSFSRNTFSIMVELWSFERQAWVTRLSDFNINDQNSG